MSADRLAEIHARKVAVHSEFSKLDRALAEGKISSSEYRHYIVLRHGGRLEHEVLRELEDEERALRASHRAEKREHRLPIVAAALIFAMVLGLGAVALLGGGGSLTGLVTFEPSETVAAAVGLSFSEDAVVPLNITDATSLAITGSLANGSADVFLLVGADRLPVYSGEAAAPPYSVTTDKSSYALGGAVVVSVVPLGAEHTLWLTSPGGEKSLVDSGFIPAGPGVHSLDALINDSGSVEKVSVGFIVREDADPSLDAVREPVAPSVSFSDACLATCELAPTGDAALSLEVVLSPGAVLRFDSVSVDVPRANAPPVALSAIPDVNVSAGEAVLVDLSSYFSDPDGDNMTFDFMSVPGVEMTVEDSVLRVAGVAESSQQSVVYASDLYSITASNAFTITVTPGVVVLNETNDTGVTDMNLTTNTTNITETNITWVDIPVVESNVTANATEPDLTNVTDPFVDPCADPNINARPEWCFAGYVDDVYEEVVAPLRDRRQGVVGRFGRYGNLIIRGTIVESSLAAPDEVDFVLGYTSSEGYREEFMPTAWIDSETGDLHLRGLIYEERPSLSPPQYGSYIVQNPNGLILAYFDEQAGDLYLKGNLVQLGRVGQ